MSQPPLSAEEVMQRLDRVADVLHEICPTRVELYRKGSHLHPWNLTWVLHYTPEREVSRWHWGPLNYLDYSAPETVAGDESARKP